MILYCRTQVSNLVIDHKNLLKRQAKSYPLNSATGECMVHPAEIKAGQVYQCQGDIDLYKSAEGNGLVTQAASGRRLHLLTLPSEATPAAQVCLCEDDYPGWLMGAGLAKLIPAERPHEPPVVSAADIQARIPAIIRFTKLAQAQPNTYLWGGTVGPNYDCSGLMQAAFASVGVLLPRDSYQQEAFATPVEQANLQPGDLIFFGSRDRTTHVALHLGSGQYIHSSGKAQGRNGIGIDSITDLTNPVSQAYYQQLRGFGRVTQSYQPRGTPILCR